MTKSHSHGKSSSHSLRPRTSKVGSGKKDPSDICQSKGRSHSKAKELNKRIHPESEHLEEAHTSSSDPTSMSALVLEQDTDPGHYCRYATFSMTSLSTTLPYSISSTSSDPHHFLLSPQNFKTHIPVDFRGVGGWTNDFELDNVPETLEESIDDSLVNLDGGK
ncbi:hypothetical protein PVAG01_11197 [Phlyctema vagabunda]|uniref:Uncharacterized protein n=1 Tax=Phlyctema vagabunda TaxID=108571 RepID=A0ABR4P1L2_9HELO